MLCDRWCYSYWLTYLFQYENYRYLLCIGIPWLVVRRRRRMTGMTLFRLFDYLHYSSVLIVFRHYGYSGSDDVLYYWLKCYSHYYWTHWWYSPCWLTWFSAGIDCVAFRPCCSGDVMMMLWPYRYCYWNDYISILVLFRCYRILDVRRRTIDIILLLMTNGSNGGNGHSVTSILLLLLTWYLMVCIIISDQLTDSNGIQYSWKKCVLQWYTMTWAGPCVKAAMD